MLSLQDFGQHNGFYGGLSPDDARILRRALAMTYDTAPSGGTAGDASPLRPQSLDGTMRVLQQTMKHLVMGRMLPKKKGNGPVEEWNQLTSYGTQLEGFVADGSLPEIVDTTFARIYGQTKLMGVTGQVTFLTQLTKTVHSPALAIETSAKTMLLLSMMENAVFHGNSDLDSLQWDGIEKQVVDNASSNVLDARGARLSADYAADAANRIGLAPNWGIGTHVFMSPRVKRDLIKDVIPNGRWMMDNGGNNVRIGADITGIDTNFGTMQIVPVPFLTDGVTQNGGAAPSAAAGSSSTRPGTPTNSTGATTPVNANSEFAAADAGAYTYSVVAVNKYGKSAPLSIGSVTAAAGDDIRFGITPAAGPATSYYEIYRSKVGASTGTKYLIDRVAADAGGGETTFVDLNSNLPNTYKAYFMQFDPSVLQMIQLLPLARVPLGRIDLSDKFVLLSLGQIAVYAPTKIVIVKNIGLDESALGDP